MEIIRPFALSVSGWAFTYFFSPVAFSDLFSLGLWGRWTSSFSSWGLVPGSRGKLPSTGFGGAPMCFIPSSLLASPFPTWGMWWMLLSYVIFIPSSLSSRGRLPHSSFAWGVNDGPRTSSCLGGTSYGIPFSLSIARGWCASSLAEGIFGRA